MRTIGFFLCLSACSALPVSSLIRSPIDSKCQSYGLKGCPELVDGAIAYVEGDKAGATRKLKGARALNTPEQLKQFAAALRTIGDESDSGKPLVEVAALLSGEVHATASISAGALTAEPAEARQSASGALAKPEAEEPAEAQRGPTPGQLALFALTAEHDPMRLVAESVPVSDVPGADCQIAGQPATCLRRRQGPVVVTDVVASDECASRVFLLAADSDTPAFGFLWMLPARLPGIHGAQFAVGGGQWLFVGVRPAAKPQPSDRACFVTWSGFRPRLIPSPIKDPGF
jgi:hypothetical protein